MPKPFNLPHDVRELNKPQLTEIFFQLEQHRSKQLLAVSDEYMHQVEAIDKDYGSCFQVLSDRLSELSKETK